MEEFGTWGGYTEEQRFALKRTNPDLVGELVTRVRALVNLPGLRRGGEGELSPAYAEMAAKAGKVEILDKLDAVAPGLKVPQQVQVPVAEGWIEPLDLSTVVEFDPEDETREAQAS